MNENEELKSFIKVCISSAISATYCYYISSRITSGVPRLVSVLPVCSFFLVLPLFFSSVHLCLFATFSLSWLANSKLILFAFDQGPLHPLPQKLSRFICLCCLPIKPKQNPSSNGSSKHFSKWVLSAKVVTFGVLLNLYEYEQALPWIAVLALHCLHIYLNLELGLVFIGAIVSVLLRCEIEPFFNEPYLATSLQDFWSRRWNLMVPTTLRPAIHRPINSATARLVGSELAASLGILASFVVSGIMHELIFYYLTRTLPTWEVTWYFILHGFCTAAEIAVKRRTTWKPNTWLSRLLAVGFACLTGDWLFFPQLERNHAIERLANEPRAVLSFVIKIITVFV